MRDLPRRGRAFNFDEGATLFDLVSMRALHSMMRDEVLRRWWFYEVTCTFHIRNDCCNRCDEDFTHGMDEESFPGDEKIKSAVVGNSGYWMKLLRQYLRT
ncbi:MAG: hypothetical protein SCH66_01110 [Methanolobus sp.]|nr:hypothetical protein [Methanolobus sp.]